MNKIVLDVMGGDLAPDVNIAGALMAVGELDIQVLLAGDRDRINHLLEGHTYDESGVKIIHAPDVIGMDEHPVRAVRRKKESSIVIGSEIVGRGEADAFVSAGNTGAVLAAGIFKIGRISGIERPAIATVLPTPEGPTLLIDAGANVDCKPQHLADFARMGSIYAREVLEIANPRVGLLSNGEEEEKGNQLVLNSSPLIEECNINYIGHIEGRDIFSGMVDVVVCDGFVGNVVLKLTEGVAKGIFSMLKGAITTGLKNQLGALLVKPALKGVAARMDYTEYGGSPLLGVKKTAIICHGSSDAKAIYNAIKVADKIVSSGINEIINEEAGNSANASD
ncbi:MAG: phosphate acyltransferase PlsX [Halanaerobium sp.]|nr:phosphate acyltransferase PlsX [Halanaerobium sp.]